MAVAPPVATAKLEARYERQNATTGQPEKVQVMFNNPQELNSWVNSTSGGDPANFHYEVYQIPGQEGVVTRRSGLLGTRHETAFVPTGEAVLVEKH